jgi:hypothetical protein
MCHTLPGFRVVWLEGFLGFWGAFGMALFCAVAFAGAVFALGPAPFSAILPWSGSCAPGPDLSMKSGNLQW